MEVEERLRLVQVGLGSDVDVGRGRKDEVGFVTRTGANRCDGAKVCRSGSAPGKQGMKPVVKSDRIPLRWTMPKHVWRWIVRNEVQLCDGKCMAT